MSTDTRTLRVVVEGDADSAMRALTSFGSQVGKTGKDIDRTTTRSKTGFAGIGGAVAGLAAGMGALGIALGAGALITGIYSVGSAFEQNFAQVQALTGSTAAQMQGLQGRLEGMSGEFARMGLSTVDASGGMVELAKAGMNADQSLAAVTGTMYLAKAGALETDVAAATVSDTLSMFSLKAADAARVANVLANAANVTSADVGDFSEALKMTGTVASQAGISLEETTGLLSELAQAGLKGSDAGTSLKTMLMRLTAPTAEAKKELAGLGVSVFDTQGKMLPMRQIVDALSKATSGLSDEQEAAALSTIFGADAIRAAQIVTKGGVAAYDKFAAAVGKAGGAQAMAESRSAGLSGAIARMTAMAESAATAFYMKVAPALGTALNAALDGLSAAGDAAKSFFSGFTSGAAGVKESGSLFGQLGSLAAVEFGKVRAVVEPVLTSLGEKARWFGQVFETQILPFIRGLVTEAGPLLGELSATWSTSFQAIWTVVDRFLTGLRVMWDQWGSTILANARIIWSGIVAVLGGVFEIIRGILNIFIGLFTGDWSRAWEGVKQIFSGIWRVIVGLVQTAIGVVRQAITAGLILVQAVWRSAWMYVTNFFGSIWTGIKSTAASALSWVVGKFTAFVAFTRSIPGRIRGSFYGMFDGIRNAFSSAVSGLRGLWNRYIGGRGFTVPGWIPGVGGRSFRIPYLAAGGTLTRAGSVLVGERGAELLDLPAGARVRPLTGRDRRSPGSGSGSASVTVVVNVAGSVMTEKDLARSIAVHVRDAIRERGRWNGGQTGLGTV